MRKEIKQFLIDNYFIKKLNLEYFFLIICIFGIPLNLFKNRFYDNSWTIGEWLINYSGGFVRRGLPGEIIYFLSSNFNINPIIFVWIISVLSIFGLFILIKVFCRKYFYAPFLVSNLVLLAPISEDFLVRKDAFLVLIYGLSLLIVKRIKTKVISSSYGITCLNLLSILAILSHESYAIWGLPSLVIVINFILMNKRTRILKSLFLSSLLIMPSIITFILCFLFKGDLDNSKAIHYSWQNLSNILPSLSLLNSSSPDGAIYALGMGINSTIKLSLSTFTQFHLIIFWQPLMWLITIFFAIRLFGGLKNDTFVDIKKLIILIQLIPFIPLFLIARDYGRWIFIWLSSSCLLFGFLINIYEIEMITINKRLNNYKLINFFNSIKTEKAYNLILLIIGIPHCCWSLGRYFVSNPIGFAIKNFIFYLNLILKNVFVIN